MPNWCSNSFTVSHEDPAMITKFAEALTECQLFTKLVPLPTKDGEWDYGVALETWGTKWDASVGDLEVEPDGKSCYGWFDTAWGPAIQAYEKLTEAGFDVDVRYHEPGMCFAGRYTSADGEYTVEYNFENENWRDDIDDAEVLDLLEWEYDSWKDWQENSENE
jgi:hypothetical protein